MDIMVLHFHFSTLRCNLKRGKITVKKTKKTTYIYMYVCIYAHTHRHTYIHTHIKQFRVDYLLNQTAQFK